MLVKYGMLFKVFPSGYTLVLVSSGSCYAETCHGKYSLWLNHHFWFQSFATHYQPTLKGSKIKCFSAASAGRFTEIISRLNPNDNCKEQFGFNGSQQ